MRRKIAHAHQFLEPVRDISIIHMSIKFEKKSTSIVGCGACTRNLGGGGGGNNDESIVPPENFSGDTIMQDPTTRRVVHVRVDVLPAHV